MRRAMGQGVSEGDAGVVFLMGVREMWGIGFRVWRGELALAA
jgi:hypothetical protein